MLRPIFPLLLIAAPVFADTPQVVTDIAPIGSIVARMMLDVGTPTVLIPEGASPHDYALRPSEARALTDADLIVWIGPALTRFLVKPVDALTGDTKRLTLMEGPFALLATRTGDAFLGRAHDLNAHDSRNNQDDRDTHDGEDKHDEHENHDDHAKDDDHGHGNIDPHLWLDPANGVVIAGLVTDALADLDPENADVYRGNFQAFQADMATLITEITKDLAPMSNARFIVLHDAFHYFEDRFQIEASGAIMASDADAPGPRTLSVLRDRLVEDPVTCAFSEPQLNTALIATVLGEQDVSIATLNPMGDATLPMIEQYPAMLRKMADSMVACLKE